MKKTAILLLLISFIGACSHQSPTPATATASAAVRRVSFQTRDGGIVYADEYGEGERGIVLAHGGRFNKESWAEQAKTLASHGFRVIAIDLRGYGQSRGPGDSAPMGAPLQNDVLAAVTYLRSTGSNQVSAIGGSMGGGACADAVVDAPWQINSLVMLGATPNGRSEQLRCRKLFIMSRDDANADGPRLPKLQAEYDKAPEPKELIIVDGNAHAQFLFQSDQADKVMTEILRFLAAP